MSARHSLWRVSFRVGSSGPYIAHIGINGGAGSDVHSPAITASLASAITGNLSGIFAALGVGQGGDPHGVPSGSVTVEQYSHAADAWV